MQGLISFFFIRVILAFPKTFATASDIPVGEIVNKYREKPRCFAQLIIFHMPIYVFDQRMQLGYNPLIQ